MDMNYFYGLLLLIYNFNSTINPVFNFKIVFYLKMICEWSKYGEFKVETIGKWSRNPKKLRKTNVSSMVFVCSYYLYFTFIILLFGLYCNCQRSQLVTACQQVPSYL